MPKTCKLDKYGKWCYYCGRELNLRIFTLDHLIPKSKGGANSDENLVACCYRCNMLKSSLTIEEFRPIFIKDYRVTKSKYALEGVFAFEVSPLITKKFGVYSKKYTQPILTCVPPRPRPDWTY